MTRLWELARENTLATTQAVRQAAYAGVALIWVLRGQSDEIATLPLVAGALLIVTLALDLAQHIIQTARLRREGNRIERTVDADKLSEPEKRRYDTMVPKRVHTPGLFLFWSKVISVSAAYVILTVELAVRFAIGS